ncbi:MAG TPA: hypothetical protein V6D19_18260 [Stenomitos sp.]
MTKIKLLATLAVIGILVAVVGGFLLTAGRTMGQAMFGRSFAEGQLNDYVSAVLKQEVNGSRCQAIDRDRNGYVSCDYTTVRQPDVPRSIECAAWGLDGFLNRGCKTRLPSFGIE